MQALQFENPNINKWLQCIDLENLIHSIREKTDTSQWSVALRTVEACSNILERQKQVFISEIDMVKVCIYIAISEETKETVAAITMMDNDSGEFTPLQSTTDKDTIKYLCAAFLCDFPDAIFSIEGGIPLILFVKKTQEKLYVSLNNMLRCARNNCIEFALGLPKTS